MAARAALRARGRASAAGAARRPAARRLARGAPPARGGRRERLLEPAQQVDELSPVGRGQSAPAGLALRLEPAELMARLAQQPRAAPAHVDRRPRDLPLEGVEASAHLLRVVAQRRREVEPPERGAESAEAGRLGRPGGPPRRLLSAAGLAPGLRPRSGLSRRLLPRRLLPCRHPDLLR